MNFKNREGELVRWLKILGSYNFAIVHRPGRVHSNADALSRRPCLDDCSHCSRKETTEGVKVVGVIAQDNDSVTVGEPVSNSPSVLKEINYEQSRSKLSIEVVHKEASTDERCVYGADLIAQM